MPFSLREARQHRRGEGALGDRLAIAHQLIGRAAFADALAEREIARAGRGAGEDQVAEARQSDKRLPPRAIGEAEPGHLGEAARDQRRARVLAEAFAVDHPAGDREHVLDRAADLRAGNVVAEVDPEGRQGDPVAKGLGKLLVLGRQSYRGRQPGRDFMREGRAGQYGDRLRPGRPRPRHRAARSRCAPRCPSSRGSAACRTSARLRAPSAYAARA